MTSFHIAINTAELLDAAAGPEVHARLLESLFQVTNAVAGPEHRRQVMAAALTGKTDE